MKKLNWFLVFGIALFLAGCSSLTAPTATLEASNTEAISTIIPSTETPTFTLTPTLTLTPSLTPSWTPLPTFSSDNEIYTTLKQWLVGTAECSFPCWADIIPGETKWEETLYLLKPMTRYLETNRNAYTGAAVYEGSCRYKTCDAISLMFSLQKNFENHYAVHLFSKDDMVYAINIQGNALPYFRIQDVLKKHGKPSQVYLLVFPYTDYKKYSPELYLILFYPEKKLVISYYPIKLKVQGENLSTCLNSPYNFSLGVVGIDQEEWPGIEIANAGDQTTHGFQGIGGYKPIADVTKMTVDNFYQKGIDENSSLCIVTPEGHWK